MEFLMLDKAADSAEPVGSPNTLPCCGRSFTFAAAEDGAPAVPAAAAAATSSSSKRCLACQFSQIGLRITSEAPPPSHSCRKFRSCEGGPSGGPLLAGSVVSRCLSTPAALSSWKPLLATSGELQGPGAPDTSTWGPSDEGGPRPDEATEREVTAEPNSSSNNNSSKDSSSSGNNSSSSNNSSSNNNSSKDSSSSSNNNNNSSNNHSSSSKDGSGSNQTDYTAELEASGATKANASPLTTQETQDGAPTVTPRSNGEKGSSNSDQQQQQQQTEQQQQQQTEQQTEQQQQQQQTEQQHATEADGDPAGEAAAVQTREKGPLVLLITGMAGSGKSTLVKAMDEHLRSVGKRVYLINLDPAVSSLAFEANVDIRDSVDYKRVMQHYKLGPNGAILTSLNLFATKFGSLLLLLQKRSSETDVVLVDTPGQMEVFTWSASGGLITEALAATFPTAIVYTIDACRSKAPNTLLSNMVHACSVLYRHKLPFLAVFNKIDAEDPHRCMQWMKDYDLFQEALLEDDRYMGSLGRSTALALSEFYEQIQTLAVSAVTHQGFEGLPDRLEKLREEYRESFLPYLLQHRKAAQKKKLEQQEKQLERFAADSTSSTSKRQTTAKSPPTTSTAEETESPKRQAEGS